MLEAKARLDEEQEAGRRPFGKPPPAGGPSFTGAGAPSREVLECLRRDFPAINHWPDNLLSTPHVGELAAANSELEAKLGRSGRQTLEAQLDNNYQLLHQQLYRVAEGVDNLTTDRNDTRYLPGYLCGVTSMWLRGREVMPKLGYVPYAQYDAQSLGYGRLISTKGWAFLHNPASMELAIKLFTGSCSKDPEGLEDFRAALSAVRTGLHLVAHWVGSRNSNEPPPAFPLDPSVPIYVT